MLNGGSGAFSGGGGHDIRGGTGPGPVRRFLRERIKERIPKVDGVPEWEYKWIFAQKE